MFENMRSQTQTQKKYYTTCDIREKTHQQGIPHYRRVSFLSCGEGENNYGRHPASGLIGDERHWSEL